MFAIFIQLGAVLAVIVEERAKLLGAARGLLGHTGDRVLATSVAIAFVPAVVLGLLTHHWITEHLFGPRTVAAALFCGGIAILAVERWKPAISRGTASRSRFWCLRRCGSFRLFVDR